MDQYAVFLLLAPPTALALAASLVAPRLVSPSARVPPSLRVLVLSELAYLLSNVLQLVHPEPGGTLLIAKATHALVLAAPIAWFLFCAEYSGFRLRHRASYAWFAPVPAVILAAAVTVEKHALLWRSYHFETVLGRFLALRIDEYGPLFYLNVVHLNLLLLGGIYLVASRCLLTGRLHKNQAIWMSAGIALPLAYSLLHVSHLVPGLKKDFSPIVISLSGVCFSIATLRHSLFRDYPPSKRSIIELAPFGLLLVDRHGTILDANETAGALLGPRLRTQTLAGVFPGLTLPPGDREYRATTASAGGAAFALECIRLTSPQAYGSWHVLVRPPEAAREAALVAARPPEEAIVKEPDPQEDLSDRELQVTGLLLDSLSVKEIALRLCVSENTVKFHVKNIYRKIGVRKRSAIRKAAEARGLRAALPTR